MNSTVSLRSKFIDFLLSTNTIGIYQFFTKIYKRNTIKNKVENHINSLAKGQDLKVVFGGHWSNHPGWLLLNESDQDITKKLNFPDGIVDTIFTEHVIEHLEITEAIYFMEESLRVLKPGGVFRVVCPMLDVLMNSELAGKSSKYEAKILESTYAQENLALQKLGTQGIEDFTRIFLLNDVFIHHDHKFIWTADLMVKVLQGVGFSQVQVRNIGEGINPDDCIERKCRSIYLGYDWQEDKKMGFIHDNQSLAVEAIK